MCVATGLTAFIGERWRADFNKKKIPNPSTIAFNKALRPLWEDGWRPITEAGPAGELPWAPPSVVCALLVRSCAHDPEVRPGSEKVLQELAGSVSAEVLAAPGGFGRVPLSAPKVGPAAAGASTARQQQQQQQQRGYPGPDSGGAYPQRFSASAADHSSRPRPSSMGNTRMR